jgi:hypothetical protein
MSRITSQIYAIIVDEQLYKSFSSDEKQRLEISQTAGVFQTMNPLKKVVKKNSKYQAFIQISESIATLNH